MDGGLTLAENIADNGGLLASIKGYELWRTKANQKEAAAAEAARALPGLEFLNDDQLLFLGFARSFCSKSKKEAAEIQLKTDSHSPDHSRINLALANMPAFAKAFKCSSTDTLAQPEKRCSLW